ncbi:MAG: histidine phosphatase family protein [Steroidobacteraceae bacterium]|nr:histidine phosphatase family protein [Steroidobacteraceae bacterium]
MGRVLLVRHTEVALKWSGRCYGCSDVPLSRAGRRQARAIAEQLSTEPVSIVVHSGLMRAAWLAEQIGRLTNAAVRADARWRERDFGTWERRSWDSIWRETGSAMEGLLTAPDRFRPGGGETTQELAERSLAAWNALPQETLVVVVSHGGPIATLRALLAGAPLEHVLQYRVATGSITAIDRGEASRSGPFTP